MIGKTILSVVGRESQRMCQAAQAPVINYFRNAAFVKSEAAGTDLSGSWAESILRRNDVDAYQ